MLKEKHIHELVFYSMFFLAIGVCTSITISALFHILLIIPIIFYFKKIELKKILLNQWLLLLFIAFVLLSIIFNQDIAVKGYEPMTKTKYYLFGFLAILPIQKWYDSLDYETRIKKIRILVWTLIGATTFAGVYGIVRLYLGFNPLNIHYTSGDRNSGLVGMILNFAHDLVFVMVFMFSLLLSKNVPKDFINKKWLGFFLIVNLIVLYTTFSRGPIVAFLGSLPFAIYFYNKKYFKFLVIAGLIFVGIIFSIPKLKLLRPASDAERFSQWKTAVVAFKERPVLGQGFLNFENRCNYFKDKYDIDQKQFCGHAHNMFLEILASTGLLGFLTMLTWLVVWIIQLLKGNSKMAEFIIPLIVVFVLGGMTQATFTLGANLFMIMFVYSISELNLVKNN